MSPFDVKTPSGVVPMSEADYNNHPAVRNSELGYLLRSPAHWWAYKRNPPEPSDAQAFGTACHFGVLEPQKFFDRYAALPEGCDLRTAAGKAAKAELIAANRIPLKADEYQRINAIIEAVYSHPTASKYLTGGVVENAYFWTDPDTGIQCKARPDYLRDDSIYIDLKTTDDASHAEFTRSVGKWAYARQAAFYIDGLKAATGRVSAGCVLIAVEKEPPYGIGVYVLDDAAMECGRGQYKRALLTLSACQKTGVYPCYPEETQAITLPEWAK